MVLTLSAKVRESPQSPCMHNPKTSSAISAPSSMGVGQGMSVNGQVRSSKDSAEATCLKLTLVLFMAPKHGVTCIALHRNNPAWKTP